MYKVIIMILIAEIRTYVWVCELMLIKLLMMNLHAQVMYICILVFLHKIGEV